MQTEFAKNEPNIKKILSARRVFCLAVRFYVPVSAAPGRTYRIEEGIDMTPEVTPDRTVYNRDISLVTLMRNSMTVVVR